MSYIGALALGGLVVLLYFIMFFVTAQSLENNSIVDIAWGMGFVAVALVLEFFNGLYLRNAVSLQHILSILIIIWGLRLSWHILGRNKGKAEDFRYQEMRKKWGDHQARGAFFQVFLLQAVILIIVAQPIFVAATYKSDLRPLPTILGIFLFLVGFVIEVVADRQLKVFKMNARNKGRLMTSGIWSYSRHPNYFGEALLWWGLGVLAFQNLSYAYVMISPLVMTVLLRFVSGVPLLEKKYSERKEFVEYAKKTSIFVPWPRKK